MDPSTSQDDFYLAEEEEPKAPQKSCAPSPAAFWSLISILCVPSPFDSEIAPTVPQSPAFEDPPGKTQSEPEPLDIEAVNLQIAILREADTYLALSGAADLLDATQSVVMKEQRVEMQTEICNLVCDTCQKTMMEKHDEIGDRLMEALCGVLREEVNDDAAHALSALIGVFGISTRQVDLIMPIVLRGLGDASDESTCKISVNLLGDLCAKSKAATFEVFGNHLVELCMSRDADPSVKLCAFSLLSSSLVAKDQSCYLSSVLPALVQVIADSEHEAAEYQIEYCSAILEVCAGIVDAFRVKGSDTSVLEPHADTIANIINKLGTTSQLSRDLAEILHTPNEDFNNNSK